MRQDSIAQIEIDASGRLHVVPTSESFPYIWREAMEVHWDADRHSLYGPPPRDWSRARWLRQILDAARAQGCELLLTDETEWIGVGPSVKTELVQAGRLSGEAR